MSNEIKTGLEGIIKSLQEMTKDIATTYKPKGLPVAEIDAELSFSGCTTAVTLSVWGKFHDEHKGGHEPGERPYEPDDPASFEIDTVKLGESDITGDLSQRAIDDIAQYVMENCE
jgi:hypothetical protein